MALVAADPDDETYVAQDSGGGSGGGGGGGDPLNRDTYKGQPPPTSSGDSSPSAFRQVSDFATKGMPIGGGTLKPGKVGGGYGARWSMKFAAGGEVSSASSRGDGIAQRGKTKGRCL